MDTDVALAPPSAVTALEADVARLVDHARDLMDASRADATRRAYAADWNDFHAFCHRFGFPPLPADPATVALYVADLSSTRDLALSTIGRRVAAISVAHAEAGCPSPTDHREVRKLMAGLRRTKTVAPTGHKRALTIPELRRMIAVTDDTLAGRRNRALLLTGFVGGLRRSELVALSVGDLHTREQGLTATIRRSKTDQEGHAHTIALPYAVHRDLCPVTALRAWLDAAQIERGAIFRRIRRGDHLATSRLSAQSVALVIKQLATAAEIHAPDQLAGHSLRSGFVTAAAANGAPERAIAHQTGHRSTAVLRRYVHAATVFDDNAATELGL